MVHHNAVVGADLHTLHVKQGRSDGRQGLGGAVKQEQADPGFVDDAGAVKPEGIFVKDGKVLPLKGQILQSLPAGLTGQVLQAGFLFQILAGLQHIGIGGKLANDRGVQRYGEYARGFAAAKAQAVEGGVLLPAGPQGLVRRVPLGGEQKRIAAVPDKGFYIALAGQLPHGLAGGIQPQVGVVAVLFLVCPVGDQGGGVAVRGPGQIRQGIEGQKIFQFNCLHCFSLPYAFKWASIQASISSSRLTRFQGLPERDNSWFSPLKRQTRVSMP